MNFQRNQGEQHKNKSGNSVVKHRSLVPSFCQSVILKLEVTLVLSAFDVPKVPNFSLGSFPFYDLVVSKCLTLGIRNHPIF